ncbi:hypothetical protein CUR178_04964 [Leishmania enriettii]|uniref:Uncharacterized protein n=1 Tax=Leishmania enriettii TaxID=5663 RepID=A0A836KJN0_LEIEN|nr:hypothetical protein CUR178_04964 [Leishmania enriettii]
MVSSSSSMQMLLAHQFMHCPSAPLAVGSPAPAASAERAPRLQSRSRRLPFSVPATSGLCNGEDSSLLYSSVNHITHRLPETCGVHYPEAPYYRGRNNFDVQLVREASLSRRGRPLRHAFATNSGTHTVPAASQQRRYKQAMPTRLSKDTTHSYGQLLPRLCKRSSASSVSARRHLACNSRLPGARTADSGHLTLFSRPDTARRQSSCPAASDSATAIPETTLEPCMRCTVRWAVCVVRDEVAADKMVQFERFVSTVVR